METPKSIKSQLSVDQQSFNSPSTKARNIFKRFNSINETNEVATNSNNIEASVGSGLTGSSAASHSLNLFSRGLKQRLSLKIIKKRDSLISKLEEDQKFLNR
jgi:subtilase family serine protease